MLLKASLFQDKDGAGGLTCFVFYSNLSSVMPNQYVAVIGECMIREEGDEDTYLTYV